VDGSGSGYLKSVCDYVHLNPARANLVAADAPFKNFAWSSWPAYVLARSKRPAWLRVGTSRIIVGGDRGGRGKTGCESGSFQTSESSERHS
jgi:hypothetical protein